MNEIFEKAARLKIRFNFRGLCTAEDLWDVITDDLKPIYGELQRKLKDYQDESLDEELNPEEEILKLKAAIVKHIFKTKRQEQLERESAKARADEKQELLGLLKEKEFTGMTKDDVQKRINEL